MYTLNRATLIGNLTRDPEVRVTPGGTNVANFSVATSYSKTDNGQRVEKTEFHHIVAFGRLAEIIQQYVTKGRKVFVEGHLQTREWETQDGLKRNRTEIVAESLIILDKPSHKPESSPTEGNNEPEIKPEDIPF